MIVITTPTGDIGAQVLDRVLDRVSERVLDHVPGGVPGSVLDGGEAVRVIARDPSRLSRRVHAEAEVTQGSHSDPEVITAALDGADSLFWLVPPARGFRHDAGSERYYLDFTRPMSEAIAGRQIRVVGVSTLGHGYRGTAGVLSAALAMDALIESTGVSYRSLALPFFMENLLRQIDPIREQGMFSMANSADRPVPAVATRDVAAVAATLLLDRSWSGQASVPVASPDHLTPDEMAEVMSETLRRPIRYHQIPVPDLKALMLKRGASEAMAQDMTVAQNNGFYDAEPCDPAAAAPTGFRAWCEDTLRPAVEG